MYKFTDEILSLLKSAFLNAEIKLEYHFESFSHRSWDYIYFQFKENIVLKSYLQNYSSIQQVVDIIFSGDEEFTKKYISNSNDTIEAGFRWVGINDVIKDIALSGFAVKFSYDKKQSEQTKKIFSEKFVRLLQEFFLPDCDVASFQRELLNAIICPINDKTLSNNSSCSLAFFSHTKPKQIDLIENVELIENAKKWINTHISSIAPKYSRQNENCLNPVYCEVDKLRNSLKFNQKLIWILRADGLLVTGVKNAYWIQFGDNSLSQAIDQISYPFVNWNDRCGHTSLVDDACKGKALYGGYLCQKNNHLEVFTSSGRFYRTDLTTKQKEVLEAYLCLCFQKSYGKQNIIFCDGPYVDYFELSLFFTNQNFPAEIEKTKRTYNSQTAKTILENIDNDEYRIQSRL